MGKEDLFNCIKEQTDKIIDELIKLDTIKEKEKVLWQQAMKKEDLIGALGLGLRSVTRGIRHLILEGELFELKNPDEDKRIKKYVSYDEFFNNMVRNRKL